MSPSKTFKIHFSLFFVSLIYAATFTIAKEVMPHYIKPFGLICIRVCGAAVLFNLTHALFIKEKLQDKKDLKIFFLCGIFGVAANMLLFFKGLALTQPINAAVIMVTTPLFVGILAFVLHGEKVTVRKILGLILGLGGAVLLLSGKNFSFRSATVSGDIMVMLNAMIYSYYLILAKPLTKKYYPLTVVRWTFMIGALLVLPFGMKDLLEIHWSSIPFSIWLSIFFLVFGSTFLTYLLNGWALRYVNSSVVGAYIYLQPILASFIAILSGKDSLSPEKILFSLLIFLGVYLVSFPKDFFEGIGKIFSKSKSRPTGSSQ